MVKRILRPKWIIAACLAGFVAANLVNVFSIERGYAAEVSTRERANAYKPSLPTGETVTAPAGAIAQIMQPDNTAIETASDSPDGDKAAAGPGKAANPSILALQEKNADALGWLTITHTAIDYPFVQGRDNILYLHRDIDGKQSSSGTLFLDSRCQPDLSGFNNLIFGHNMKSGAMFHDLRKFADSGFWDVNTSGWLFLADVTYELRFFAFLVVDENDPVIYRTVPASSAEQKAFLDYVRRHAEHYRDLDLSAGEKILTLSTCSYDYDGARMVLLAWLTPVVIAETEPVGAKSLTPIAPATPLPVASPIPIATPAPAVTPSPSPMAAATSAPAEVSAESESAGETPLDRRPFLCQAPLDMTTHAVTSPFGLRVSPISGVRESHYGVDIGAREGEGIHAFAAGTVTFAGWTDTSAYTIEIDHNDGFETRYLHCSKLLVAAGDQVAMGQEIALTGSGGVSTGPHLHFELLKDGKQSDPQPWISK